VSTTSPEPTYAPARASLRALRALPALPALALAICTWPVATLVPGSSLDYSWVIGLNLAFHDGLDYGRDVVFTYGPLGFLQTPQLVFPWPMRLAFCWVFLVQVALAGTLLWSMRRGLWSWWIAVPVTLVLLGIVTPDPTLTIGFTGAVAIMTGLVREPRATQLLAIGLGAMTGIQVLAKINVGITLLVILAIAAAAAPDRRRVAPALGGAFLATAGLAWILTGQSITAVPGYITGALAITSGYSSAMIVEAPSTQWHFWAAGVVVAIGFVVAWRVGEALPGRTRVGLLAAWAALSFASFKSGFVRHDLGHTSIFFTNTLGCLTAFAWATRRRELVLIVGLVPALCVFAVLSANPRNAVRPLAHVQQFSDQLKILADGSRTNDEIAAARDAVAKDLKLAPLQYGEIKDRRTHMDPYDISVAWAYRLSHWQPLPIFQNYSAYTTSLDERNADLLRDPKGPERILRRPGSAIDGRNPAWEPPAAMRAMLCHFRPAGAKTNEWEVLERVPDRCGAAHEIAVVDGRLGQPIPVPPVPNPNELMYVKIDGFAPGPLEKLRKLLYRAYVRGVVLDGSRGWRAVADTVEDGLILHVPGFADFGSGSFALDQGDVETIQLLRGEGEQADASVTLHFIAQPITE
jgi:hypothetical protein